jgi:dihydrofolate reductase
VFSHHPKDDDKATYIHGNIAEQVAAIKQQPGKDIWLYGGGKLITTFIELGLIDVYRLAVHPVLLGEGKPLFSGFKNRVGLSLINSTSHKSGVVLLEYALRAN